MSIEVIPRWNPDRWPTHVRQPNDYTCGPSVVAMILGCSVDIASTVLRTKSTGGTRHEHIIALLKGRGVPCGDRFKRCTLKTVPKRCIVRVYEPRQSALLRVGASRGITQRDVDNVNRMRLGHVLLKWYNAVYDPAWPEGQMMDWPITSALWIGEP